jgi:oxygen-dependent protoporphyrinogen oxidase
VSSFVTRRLGREVNDYAVEPFVAGIYAGDPDQLSVQSAFPMLSGLEARYGSVLRGALKARAAARRKRRDDGDARAGNSRGAGARTSGAGRSGQLTFRGGVSELPEAIAAALDERLLLEACVTAVRRSERGFELTVQQGRRERRLQAKQVVLAVPAYAAAELVRGVDGYASEALSRIPYPPILTVTVGVSAEAFPEPPEGFGLLIPRVERRSILGVIYAHSVFPHRAPEQGVLLTVFVGGSRDRELLRRYTAEELLQRTRAELRELFGLRAEPALLRHVLWERAIPQYTVGHEQRMAALRAAEERHRGLRFLGNYRGGVAVANCLAEARRTAEAVAGR